MNKRKIQLLSITLLTAIIITISIIPMVQAPSGPVSGSDFYGFDPVSDSWTKGNLAGYFEGEYVSYLLLISGTPGADISGEYFDILFDFYDDKPDAVTLDYLTNFQWANNDFSGPGTKEPPALWGTPFTPSILSDPITTPDTCITPSGDRYFRLDPGYDTFPTAIPGTGVIAVYFEAHLSRSIVWLNKLEKHYPDITNQIDWALLCDTPHWGSSAYSSGAPLHFWLEASVGPSGAYKVPIPVPPSPEGIIEGHKWEDVNVNGIYDEGIDNPIEGWHIYCSGEIDGVSIEFETLTDANGYYVFNLLTEETWTISENTIEPPWIPTPGTDTSIDITLPLPPLSPYGTEGSTTATDVDFFNYRPGKIIVDKVTDPSESTQSFDFTTDAGASFSLADLDTPWDSGWIVPDDYYVDETVPPGWELTSAITDDDDGSDPASIVLDPGEIVHVTFYNKQLLEFLKQFTGSGALNGFDVPDGDFPGITSTINQIKTGPQIWWEVTYSVTNEDDGGHYYTLWDKWGGNLLILGSHPTDYTPGSKRKEAGTVILADGASFKIDSNGYNTYLDGNGDITSNINHAATHIPSGTDGAWLSMHTGDQQEGTNPGKGKKNDKDGKSYDVDVRWNIGWLEPGESQTLTVYLTPGINPGGVLQFSSYGTNVVNTGPRVRAYETYNYENNEFLYSWDWSNQLTIIAEPLD